MIKKVLLSIAGIIGFIILAGVSYLYMALPDAGPLLEISVEGTPGQVERGRYLAKHVTVCLDCHSQRDWNKFSGPIVPGTEGMGGEIYDHKFGLPGSFVAKNITPHNLQNWTDSEIYRLITTGITKEGEPIFPFMPYPYYRKMDPEDTKAIIAYIRTLEPIEYTNPASNPDFPINLIMRTIPQPAAPVTRPSQSDTVAYGEYLVTIAGCIECHTPRVQGTQDVSRRLAGGFEFTIPGFGTVRSANITPDTATGIGLWTEEIFVNRFKQYEDMTSEEIPAVSENQFNTVMPWTMFAGMKEGDLKAIFAYLKSVEPVKHRIIKFTPESEITASN